MPPTAPRSRPGELGQATVELVALLPLVVVLGALLWQAVVAGQAIWFAGSAARAAARASAIGHDARAAARRVLPEHLERGLTVRREREDKAVRVSIAIPAIVGAARVGSVSARAGLQDQTR